MNKPTKVLFAISTLLPLAYVCFLFVALFLHLSSLIVGIPRRNIFLELFQTLFFVHFGMMAWLAILTLVYVIHIARNPALTNEMKAVWVTAVGVGNVFAMPVYWYFHIWGKRVPRML
jgi:hypothetical protein